MDDLTKGILVPLPLAELLHAMLGSLLMVLQEEDHAWVPVCEKVLSGYQFQRNELINDLYGKDCTEAIHMVEGGVIAALTRYFHEVEMDGVDIDPSSSDFAEWARELGRDD